MEAVVNYKQPIFSGISFLILLNQRSSLYRSCINWDYWGMSNTKVVLNYSTRWSNFKENNRLGKPKKKEITHQRLYIDTLVIFQANDKFEDRWQVLPQYAVNATWLGADNNNEKLGTYFLGYLPVGKRVNAGFDVAWSNDDFAFYLTIGSAWMR